MADQINNKEEKIVPAYDDLGCQKAVKCCISNKRCLGWHKLSPTGHLVIDCTAC